MSARLLNAEEFAALPMGCGWLENMYDEDDIVLERFAWAGEYTVSECGNSTMANVLKFYGKRDGMRVWLGEEPPTDEQRGAVTWG